MASRSLRRPWAGRLRSWSTVTPGFSFPLMTSTLSPAPFCNWSPGRLCAGMPISGEGAVHQRVVTSGGSMIAASPTRASDPAASAQASLRASAYSELRALACDSHEGVLSIRGRVSSFYLKQLAQAAVRDVPGIEVIHNQVQVVLPHDNRD